MRPHGISRSPFKKVIKEERPTQAGIWFPPALNKIIMQTPPPLMTLVGKMIHLWVMITPLTQINKLITRYNLPLSDHPDTDVAAVDEDDGHYCRPYAPYGQITLEFTQTPTLDRFHPRSQTTLYASVLVM
jgi:hypothetical protein